MELKIKFKDDELCEASVKETCEQLFKWWKDKDAEPVNLALCRDDILDIKFKDKKHTNFADYMFYN